MEKDEKRERGLRLAEVRTALGYPNRPPFAAVLDIPADTLGSYERGTREPALSLLAIYADRFGVNLNWIATGNGKMFNLPSTETSENDARLLHDFRQLPENRQLDIMEITQMHLRRIQRG